MSLFSKDVGIDLGTANTLVYMKGKGIIMREPSVVAVDTKSDEVRCVGAEAKAVIGRTPGSIVAVRPLKDGVIADFDITANMLETFLKKACGNSRIKDTVLKEKFISAYNEFIERRLQGDSMVALQEVLEDLRQQEQELAELMMQRLIPKAAYEEERKSVKMQITDISDKISERRAKRVPASEYVSITEFSEEKAKRFLSKVVVTMFTVTFVFYNGAKITRTYDNGQPGNKVGWNKKKEES